jgi:hypothetical protein
VGYLVDAGVVLWRARGERLAALRRVGPGLLAVAAAAMFERNYHLLILPASRLTVDLAAWAAPGSRRVWAGASAVVVAPTVFTIALLGVWSPALAWRNLSTRAYWTNPLHADSIPVSCTEKLAGVPAGTRVLAPRVWASWVILSVPQARVFIDGRNREYPLAIFRAANHVLAGGPGAPHLLSVTGTEWVIAEPAWGALPVIRASSWRPVFVDRACALYAPSPSPAGGPDAPPPAASRPVP